MRALYTDEGTYSNLKAKNLTCYFFLELKVNVHIGCHF